MTPLARTIGDLLASCDVACTVNPDAWADRVPEDIRSYAGLETRWYLEGIISSFMNA